MTTRVIGGRQLRMAVSGQSDIGECRRSAKRLAAGFGFDEVSEGRIGIVVTELATNIVRHAGSGDLLLQILDDGMVPEFEVLAIDKAQGMRDVDACMRDGYSTGGTAGQGLGAVSRMSSTFDMHSMEGKGTVVLSRISGKRVSALQERAARGAPFEFGAISIAVAGEVECGDIWRIAEDESRISLLVADGLGHGPLAARAAQAAVAAFAVRPFDDPSMVMQNVHLALIGGRGAAAACAQLRPNELAVNYSGVGNIGATIATSERSRGMVSHNGTLGVQLLRVQQFAYEWPQGSHVIMHSDGLSARWTLSSYPGLQARHSGVIAAVLYRDFARQRDDATVMVACYRP
jgi:anti-sigma regulatory factor (Ser/Thr protein kinase)